MQNTKSREVLGELGDDLRRQALEMTTDDVKRKLERVRIINTWENRYRVDFFCKVVDEKSELMFPTRAILDSRFCHVVDGKLIDKTIQPTEG